MNLNERIIAAGVKHSTEKNKTWINNNVLVVGSSGAGKTTGFVCPNLNNPSGSFVVSDTKGQLYKMFASKLRKKGYLVHLINLVNPEHSFGYNPLDYIRRRKDGSVYEPDIKKLAKLIVPALDRAEPYWENSAARYISMLIGYVVEALPREEQNMESILELHRSYYEGPSKVLLSQLKDSKPDSYAGRRFAAFQSIENSEKTWSCIYDFASEALDAFDCEEYKKLFTSEKKINLHDLGKRKTAVFINSSDHDRSYHILCSIINAQLLQTLIDDADNSSEGSLDIPVSLFLDDFAAAAAIPDFEMAISVIRSRNISVNILLQSISQLTNRYGEQNATTIINNCDTILYLGGGHDIETARFIAEHINMTPSSVLSLPSGKAILVVSGQKPAIVDKIKPNDEITGLVS